MWIDPGILPAATSSASRTSTRDGVARLHRRLDLVRRHVDDLSLGHGRRLHDLPVALVEGAFRPREILRGKDFSDFSEILWIGVYIEHMFG